MKLEDIPKMSDEELIAAHFAESCSEDGYGLLLCALREEVIRRYRKRENAERENAVRS